MSESLAPQRLDPNATSMITENGIGALTPQEFLNTIPPAGELPESGQALLATLRDLHPGGTPEHMGSTGMPYRNAEIAQRVRKQYHLTEFRDLRACAQEEGTLTVPIMFGKIAQDGGMRLVPLVAAIGSKDGVGEMFYMLYLRDQLQVAWSFIEEGKLGDKEKAQLGRELLLAGLELMSSPNQLRRQEYVIEHGTEAGQLDHPHISFMLDDLATEETVKWRHKQDTLAMQAHLAFYALNESIIHPEDLSDAQKQFLTNIIPFMEAIEFPNHNSNSGSWEEYEATCRTSVTAVQVGMLHELQRLFASKERASGLGFQPDAQAPIVDKMIDEGLELVGRQLPFETPNEDKASIRYREVDATILYTLRYDITKLLAERQIPIGQEGKALPERDIENIVLKAFDTLIDQRTGGSRRYPRDSYQGPNFILRHDFILAMKDYVQARSEYTGVPPNLEEKQELRGLIVPVPENSEESDEREAMWTHPVFQAASWAARRSLRAEHEGNELDAHRYRESSTRYLNQGLRLVTGVGEHHIELNADGSPAIAETAPFRLPEAYNTFIDAQGPRVLASQHNQLNWAAAMASESFGFLEASLELECERHLGGLATQNHADTEEAPAERLAQSA
jgi:hypothetical protein